jgi:hypothetical protein
VLTRALLCSPCSAALCRSPCPCPPQLEMLVSGVRWPADVDPAAREQRLPDAQFEQLFGMRKAAFNALPAFKRSRLKQALGLF